MSEKFYVNTIGAVSANKLSEAVSLGKELAKESKAAGSARASVGTMMTAITLEALSFNNSSIPLMTFQM